MAKTETKKTNGKKQKEEEKKRKAGKILQKKLDEIEAFGTVTDKQTGKWTYIDKDGKPAKILFDEKTKAFEVKKGEDNLYYATVELEYIGASANYNEVDNISLHFLLLNLQHLQCLHCLHLNLLNLIQRFVLRRYKLSYNLLLI